MTEELNNLPEEFEDDEVLDDALEDEPSTGDQEENLPDPVQVITLRTSGGETRYIPTGRPLSLGELKGLSGLTFGAATFYFNAAVVDDSTIIPVGGVVTAIGNVKGG